MSESVGNASSATPDLDDLKSYMKAKRVYEELGSKKNCQALIDKAPKLLYEDELVLRLHSKTGKLKQCKVYIFDDYFLVGSQRLRKRKPQGSKSGMEDSTGMTTASSSDSGVVWFGSNKASEDTSVNSKETPDEPKLDYDSDISYGEFLDDIAKIEERKEMKEKRLYNLKMWVDLGKIKPHIMRGEGLYGISIVYVSKVAEQISPGEFRYNTVVDQAEIWMEDEKKAKTICGLIQDAVDKKALEALREISKQRKAEERQRQLSLKTDGSATDTDTDNSIPEAEDLGRSSSKVSTKSGTTSTSSERRKRSKRKFLAGKQALQATVYMNALSPEQRKNAPKVALTYKDVQNRYAMFTKDIKSDQHGVAESDEGHEAEFTVNFKNSQLGLALSSSKRIGPFVARTIPNGLAEASGVCPGDKVMAINNVEISLDTSWKECVKIIGLQKQQSDDLNITFRRKQKNELHRIEKEEAQRKAFEETDLREEEERLEAKDEGKVTAEEETAVIGQAKTLRRFESVEMKKKTNGAYTMKKKKTGKRKWARKRKILEDMKHLNVGRKEFKEFKKHKKKMFELFDQIEDLFYTVKEYSPSKQEQNCLHAMREIYDSEYKYHANLNQLRGIHMALLTAQKNVICKHLKSSKPFCEHRRPRRFCTQESSFREEAIDHNVVNSIFLNLKTIIKSNQYLFRNLQIKLGKLYEKGAQGEKIEVFEMLEVFCEVFIEIAPFLSLYWSYCKRYTKACEKQRILRAENHFFYDIVRPTEKQLKMKLPNLLAQPVQRITRYHLLFDTLQKHAGKYASKQKELELSDEHLEKLENATKGLKEANKILIGLAQKVNNKVGEANLLDKILPIYEEIGGKDKIPDLIAPHRRFDSKHEVGYEHNKLDISEDKALLYLFNDKIALAVVRETASAQKPSKYSLGRLMKTSKSSIGKDKKLSLGTVISESEAKKRLSEPSHKQTKKKKSGPKLTKKKSFGNKTGGTLKKFSLRLSNERSKTKTHRLSTGSKDSKGSELFYYDVLFHFPMREVGVISERNKTKDEVTMYGVDIYYSKKHKEGSDTTSLTIWVDDKEKREELKNTLNSLVKEDQNKRAELKKIRDQMLGKKQRKFAQKKDAYKRGSLVAGGRAKSSLYSKV